MQTCMSIQIWQPGGGRKSSLVESRVWGPHRPLRSQKVHCSSTKYVAKTVPQQVMVSFNLTLKTHGSKGTVAVSAGEISIIIQLVVGLCKVMCRILTALSSSDIFVSG